MADIGTTADVFYYGTQNQTIDSMYSGSLPGLHPKNNQGLGVEPSGTDHGKIVLVEGAGVPPAGPLSPPTPTVYYRMQWYDVDCMLFSTWRTWTVTGAPDPNGSYYSGPKCGATPITGATIAHKWRALSGNLREHKWWFWRSVGKWPMGRRRRIYTRRASTQCRSV